MTGLDWDPASYDRISDFQLAMGREVLERLELEGDETVLDAGCGTGRVTELIAARLPRGRAIGADASPAMIAAARERLGPGVELIVGDLLELELAESVDVVFSNATFHWIADHARLFDRVASTLRPGGLLEAQFGARGNVLELREGIRRVASREPFRAHLDGFDEPFNFPTVEDTERLLRAAGFDDVRCWLDERIAVIEDRRAFHGTMGTIVYRERLPVELHEPFMEQVLAETEEPTTFVRLNVSARRAV
jgi:trans-aconitate 2-methyltransferase